MPGTRSRGTNAAAAAPGAPARAARRERWLLAGILLLAIAVYARTLGNGFIYFDDPDVVVNNPWIREIGAASAARWLTRPVQYMYMPLALFSYALDYRIGKLDPFVYHLDNLVLHLANVVLVFRVFRRLGREPRVALLVALLFAVHPVQVDTVASVAARTNLLATLFSLAALELYGVYLARGLRVRWLGLACLSFVLACAAKASAVVLPVTLLLWDGFQGRRWERRLVVEKLPFFAIALAFGGIALRMRVDVPPPVAYGALDRVLVFVHALAVYLVRLVYPSPLSLSYVHPAKSGPWLPLPVYLSPVLLALAGWGLWKSGIPRRVLVFGLSFFAVHVALSQSVLLLDGFTANRYAYLAYPGLFLLLAELWERARAALAARARPALRIAAAAAAAALLAGAALLAARRTAVWRDSLALFDDVIAKGQGSAWVYGTRGLVKMHQRDLAGARQDLDRALALDPGWVPGLCYRGAVRFLSGDYPAALADLDLAIAKDAAIPGAYRDRGKVKTALGDLDGALADFDRAIALDATSDARLWRGMVRSERGDFPGAVADFDAMIAAAPEQGDAWFLRGLVRLDLGEREAACADVAKGRALGYAPPAGTSVPECP